MTKSEQVNRLKKTLNPAPLLKLLKAQDMIDDLGSHKIWVNEKGEYRITCFGQNLNTVDFMTKFVGLGFEESADILIEIDKGLQGIQVKEADEFNLSLFESQMKLLKAHTKDTHNFIKNHVEPYFKAVDLNFIEHDESGESKGRRAFVKNLPVSQLSGFVKEKKIHIGNANEKNIYFAVSKDSTSRVIWLDDVKPDRFTKYMTIIQTSKDSYQAFIKFDRCLSDDEFKVVRDKLVETYDSDRAAKARIQPMRLPGFLNQKPKHKTNGVGYLIKLVQESFKEFSVDATLSKLGIQKSKPISQMPSSDVDMRIKSSPKKVKELVEKPISDFDCDDKSARDFKYVLHLMNVGLSENEIKDRLKQYAGVERKSNPTYYIETTCQKASEVFCQPVKKIVL